MHIQLLLSKKHSIGGRGSGSFLVFYGALSGLLMVSSFSRGVAPGSMDAAPLGLKKKQRIHNPAAFVKLGDSGGALLYLSGCAPTRYEIIYSLMHDPGFRKWRPFPRY